MTSSGSFLTFLDHHILRTNCHQLPSPQHRHLHHLVPSGHQLCALLQQLHLNHEQGCRCSICPFLQRSPEHYHHLHLCANCHLLHYHSYPIHQGCTIIHRYHLLLPQRHCTSCHRFPNAIHGIRIQRPGLHRRCRICWSRRFRLRISRFLHLKPDSTGLRFRLWL